MCTRLKFSLILYINWHKLKSAWCLIIFVTQITYSCDLLQRIRDWWGVTNDPVDWQIDRLTLNATTPDANTTSYNLMEKLKPTHSLKCLLIKP